MKEELRKLLKQFYTIFDELKQAFPSLTGEAYECMAKDILEQYKLEYPLLDGQHRTAMQQEIERLRAQYERLVPDHWETRFLHKPRQNYAAMLIGMEADQDASRFFAAYEEKLGLLRDEECPRKMTRKERKKAARAAAYLEMQAKIAAEKAERVQTAQEGAENTQYDQEAENTERGAESMTESATEGNSEAPQETEEPADEDFDLHGIDTEYEIFEEDKSAEMAEAQREDKTSKEDISGDVVLEQSKGEKENENRKSG